MNYLARINVRGARRVSILHRDHKAHNLHLRILRACGKNSDIIDILPLSFADADALCCCLFGVWR